MTCAGCGCRRKDNEDNVLSDVGFHGRNCVYRSESAMKILVDIAKNYEAAATPSANNKLKALKKEHNFISIANGLWGFCTFDEPLLDLYSAFAPDVLHSFDLGVWQGLIKSFSIKAGVGKKAEYERLMTRRYSELRDHARCSLYLSL